MKELLTAIKTRLQAELTYVRSGDIFITPHENYIPEHVKFPCIGIKDGPITREARGADFFVTTMQVVIAIYAQLLKDEASIMGDASIDQKGVLEVADDIDTALHENNLDITGIQAAACLSERASEVFGDENTLIQQKIVTFTYTKYETKTWGAMT